MIDEKVILVKNLEELENDFKSITNIPPKGEKYSLIIDPDCSLVGVNKILDALAKNDDIKRVFGLYCDNSLKLSNIEDQEIRNIADLRIEKLYIDKANFTDVGITTLITMVLPDLTELSITSCPIGLNALQRIINNGTNLTLLNADENCNDAELESGALECLTIPQDSNLKYISCRENSISRFIFLSRSVKTLNIEGNCVNSETLTDIFNLPEIETLSMSNNQILPDDLTYIEYPTNGPLNFTKLNLSNNYFNGGNGLKKLLDHTPKLKSLFLGHCKLEDKDLKELIGTLNNIKDLTELILSGNKISNSDNIISIISGNHNLRYIDLSNCGLDKAAIYNIAYYCGLENKNLKLIVSDEFDSSMKDGYKNGKEDGAEFNNSQELKDGILQDYSEVPGSGVLSPSSNTHGLFRLGNYNSR